MRQTNLFEFLGDISQAIEQELHKTLEEANRSQTDRHEPDEPKTTNMPKKQAIILSIEDVLLNTLQDKQDITKDKVETMLGLARLRQMMVD